MNIELKQVCFDFEVDEISYKVYFTPQSNGKINVKVCNMDNHSSKPIISDMASSKTKIIKATALSYLKYAITLPF